MKVGVVGAGLAGLTAAYRLQQYGFDVTVFEARNRVGGRVFSVEMENYAGERVVAELGGQNIVDGGDAENLLGLAAELSLPIETKSVAITGAGSVYCNGEFYDFDHLFAPAMHRVDDVDTFLGDMANQVPSIGALIEKLFPDNEVIQKALKTRMIAYEGVPVDQQSVYHNIDTLRACLEGGVAPAHDHAEHVPYHITVKSIQGGNASLPEALASALGERVRCNKILTSVVRESEVTRLTFADGSSELCDVVVMAMPATTYKNIDLSRSGVPADRSAQIDRITYGNNYKILLPLDFSLGSERTFAVGEGWIAFFNTCQTIVALYNNEPLADVAHATEIAQKALQARVTPLPPVITAEDRQYAFYPGPVTHPWKDDRFAGGSYSGYSTSISKELDEKRLYNGVECKVLFAPIDNKIFFAGEHATISEYIGTMEAAVESGERVARMIVSSLK